MSSGHRRGSSLAARPELWVFAVTLLGMAYLLVLKFWTVSSSAQSLYWSEFTHIFDSSRIYAGLIYSQKLPFPLLDPAKAMLDGLSLIPAGRSLWTFRLWTSILAVLLPLWVSIALVRRISPPNRWIALSLVFLGVIFLQQGPVYYHPLIAPALLLTFYHPKKPALNFFLIAAGSLWAGICRINWVPFTGTLAALLYLLETPVGGRRLVKYIARPFLYIISGVSFGLLSYFLYAQLTGQPMINIDPAYNYSFWPRRWLPNELYSLGVLPGIILVSFPAAAWLAIWTWKSRRSIQPLRLAGIYSALAVYLGGGLVISMRIGGSFNLHNLDGYLLLLLVITAYGYFNRICYDREPAGLPLPSTVVRGLTTLMVVVPILYVLVFSPIGNRGATDAPDYARIQELINEGQKSGRPVLFLDFGHLLTFGILRADLFPYYDKVYLMEMLMANQTALVSEFADKVYNHDFSLIISTGEYYPTEQSEVEDILAPEEFAWQSQISIPILDNYEAVYQAAGLVVYSPLSE